MQLQRYGSESQRVEVSSVAMGSVLDTLQPGILLFNEQCEVLFVNSSAQAVIDSKGWLWLADRKLKCRAAENAGIQHRIRAAVQQRFSGSDSLMILNGAQKEDFLLLGFSSVDTIDQRRAVVCILVDPGRNRMPDISLLKNLYSLTDAEIDITSMIAGGSDYGDIAKKRNVAITTIRSYTKSIFKKLGVSSRAGVVYKTQTTMLPLSMLSLD